MKRRIIYGMIITAVAVLLIIAVINGGKYELNDAQKQSLCEALVDIDDRSEDREFKNSAVVASVDLFGVNKAGDKLTAYGYFDEGFYVEARGKGYEISGGVFEFMADIRVQGDAVSVVKKYGDGVSTMSTLKEMPFIYRCKWKAYLSMGLDRDLMMRNISKVEKELGVPADTKCFLDIDDGSGRYKIYEIDRDYDTITKYEGDADELYK